MKTVLIQFRRGGFDYVQLARQGHIVLYRQTLVGGSHVNYVVVCLIHRPAKLIMDHLVPEREVLPPAESWGTRGWSYCDEPAARAKFDQLCHRLSNTTAPRTPNSPAQTHLPLTGVSG